MASTQPTDPDETDRLLRDAARGDQAALGSLLERHRERLRRMVALRLDPRISARVNASDVVRLKRHALQSADRSPPAEETCTAVR
jgi:RNA polymerase sigma-70 factor, ECF subfamily